MRGKELNTVLFIVSDGITPAYAGKSGVLRVAPSTLRDHPRVCGEKQMLAQAGRYWVGSPPRMRGKVVRTPPVVVVNGITPAYAGKSRSPAGCNCARTDHPRVCGEKYKVYVYNTVDKGSPPRMRGKDGGCAYSFIPAGITPAYAGKRANRPSWSFGVWDHPRVCGEKGAPPAAHWA